MSAPGAPTDLVVDGHPVRLKWHRARRTGTDRPFTLARTVEGLRAGASVEIDVRTGYDGVPRIRHDPFRRWRRTTPATALRSICDVLGTSQGDVGDPPADRTPLPASALLQLDVKDPATVVTEDVARRIASAVAGIADHVIVSGTDPVAVTRIVAVDPRLLRGHDPCTRRAVRRLRRTGDVAGFLTAALAAPAETVYLDHRLLLTAAGQGHDLVGPVHAAGRRVDAWTLTAPDAATVRRARTLLRLGVDQLTVDDPDGFARALATTGE